MSSPSPPNASLRTQQALVQGLRNAVYSQADPAGNPDLLRRLAEAQALLDQLRAQRAAEDAALESLPDRQNRGRLLGEATNLSVAPRLEMHPVPTGIYHLLDPEADPLLTVTVANKSLDRKPQRVCVRAWIEGLSAETVRTVEVKRGESATLKLLPTLFPERARAITQVQRATLHLRVDDLETGKLECHDTLSLVCLARNASFNSVTRPGSTEPVDLTHYYGAWVTPYVEAVQERIRRAVSLCPAGRLLGYQGDPEGITQQVEALYQALREAEVTYVNSVLDYGAGSGQATQRTRLPREALAARSANCIDGAVLLASLLEGASLEPAIVLVPGHAFVGWRTWNDADAPWRFLETTLIGSHPFAAACESAQRQYQEAENYNRKQLRLHPVADLRSRGIWPME